MKNITVKKLYYSISEVSRITDLEQYVLRYWESEFDHLKPQKNRAGNRSYTNKDIRLILEIKRLLREEKYTIEGAKKVLETIAKDIDDGEQLTIFPGMNKTKIKDEEIRKDLMNVRSFLEQLLQKI